jgi:hypothetical protein
MAKPFARNGFLFVSHGKGVISDMTLSQLMKRRGLEARPHGFRSSLRTWLAEATNAPQEVAEPNEAKEAPKQAVAQARAPTESKPRVDTVKPPVERGDKLRAMTPEQYAALTEDETGKSEFKLGFDSNKLADKARAEAEEKKAQKATELTEQVIQAFAKKKAQFAKCSDGSEERVRVVFTVSTMGKVSAPKVEGTKSSAKMGCIEAILLRSIFPAAGEPQTYSQTLVL